MWVSGARLLGTLASEEGEISDKARDELMTCNAHKIVIKAMNPVHGCVCDNYLAPYFLA
jgi:hypothetical protein